jgi:tRNA modification GTPase
MNELFTSSIADTIVALATAPGIGAISVIRLSGKEAITICNEVFKGKDLRLVETHTAHFGTIRDGDKIIDEVLVTVFIGPKSFTKENIVEVSCHGSPYITKEIIRVFLNHGARLAKPGEFTKRAFLNGQFDLAQAEAVADLIAADSEMSHKAALSQMRGGFSKEIKALRTELIHFASLIELELDFSEEDVEFANRDDLRALIEKLKVTIQKLLASFDLGNVIKNGVPTVIAGKPNAGKSTLLNALLNEDRAMVSDIAGTTRDVIEDEISIEGIAFRFIDTAGLRETDDRLEAMGIERTHQKMKEASLIIYLFDVLEVQSTEYKVQSTALQQLGIPILFVANKIDNISAEDLADLQTINKFIPISAAQKIGIETLKDELLKIVNLDSFKTGNTIVTNIRHYDALLQTRNALQAVLTGMDNQVTGDFLAMDIRQSLHYLGEIVGEITHEDLLDNIFSKFCIGK